MEYDASMQIVAERDYLVVKANDIIQKARFDLSLLEQKTFCYLVSKIKKYDEPNTLYTFTINEYCDVCGISRNNGKNIEDVKNALLSLKNKAFFLRNAAGEDETIDWIGKAYVSPKSGKVRVRFDETMQKYLMGLCGNFTQYSLLCVLPMRSAYSIRLYELLKSYAGQGAKEKDFEINDLKMKLNAPYANFKDFRNRALEPATREINEYTDIEISWQPINKGRKVIKVKFLLTIRDSFGNLKAAARAKAEIEGQMSLDEIL